jgi:hypothetical protein
MGVIYGLIPYFCVLKPLVAAGHRFTSVHEADWPRRNAEAVKLHKLMEMFYDGSGKRIRECTWFILRHPKGMRTEEGLIAHQRLISAVQFALLDSEGRESTLTAERVDTWLFEHLYDSSFPGLHETYWQTAGMFRAALPVVPERDKFYPRQPQLVPRRVVNMGPVIQLLHALLPPTARLGRLSCERRRLLDSLPFFIMGCSASHTVDIRVRIVNLVTAFEILLSLGQFRRDKAGPFGRRLAQCVRPAFDGFAYPDRARMVRRLRAFCQELYRLRDAIVHEGETRVERFLFRARPDEQPFLGYVWKARQLFVASVRARLGLLNPVDLAVVLDQLVSNEERLRRAHEAFGQGKADEALSLVTELRSYQTPEPLDLILAVWRDLVDLYIARVVGSPQALPAPIVESLQDHQDLSYHSSVFHRVWELLRPDYTDIVIAERTFVTFAMSHFAEYARYALSVRHTWSAVR